MEIESYNKYTNATKEVENLMEKVIEADKRMKGRLKECKVENEKEILKLKVAISAMLLEEESDFSFVEALITMTKEEFIINKIKTRDNCFNLGTKYGILVAKDLNKDATKAKEYIYTQLIKKAKISFQESTPFNTLDN